MQEDILLDIIFTMKRLEDAQYWSKYCDITARCQPAVRNIVKFGMY